MPNLLTDAEMPVRFHRAGEEVWRQTLGPGQIHQLSVVASLAQQHVIRRGGTSSDLALKPIAVVPQRNERGEIVGYDVPVD